MIPTFDDKKLTKLGRQQAQWGDRAERMHDVTVKNAHDVDTLEQQCLTRQLKENLAREEKLNYDEKMLAINRHLSAIEKQQMQEKINKERQDLQYSIDFLRRDMTREWDINDPAYLAKMRPIRIDKVDENGKVIIDQQLGVSSGQFYDGEDHEANNRRRLQYEQFKQEMEAHMSETLKVRALTKQEQDEYEKKQVAMIKYMIDQERQQEEERRNVLVNQAAENQRMAQEKLSRTQQERRRDVEEEKSHITNFAATRIMQEASRPGIVDEFKGFSKETINGYNEHVKMQIKEAEEKRARFKQQQVEDEQRQLEVARQLQIDELNHTRQRAAVHRQYAEENRVNIAYHTEKVKNITQELGRNRIDDEFQEKWEKSCR